MDDGPHAKPQQDRPVRFANSVNSVTVGSTPTGVESGRADQGDTMVMSAADEHVGVHVAGIGEVLARRQIPLRQRLLDGGCTQGLMDRGRRGRDLGDEMDGIGVTGLGQVDRIASPARFTFPPVACFRIIGRRYALGGTGELVAGLEPHVSRLVVRGCRGARIVPLP